MSYRVLVVDDTNFMRKMAADCLKQHGYEVAGEAANGKEAVKLYVELRPDIVLMDLTMPEMNGIDAIKEILKINPDAVILICSASNQQDLIFKALDAGAKGYLMKPFTPDRLYETIRTYAEPYLSAAPAAEIGVSEEVSEEIEASEEQNAELAETHIETHIETEAETQAETQAVMEAETQALMEAETQALMEAETQVETQAEYLETQAAANAEHELADEHVMPTEATSKLYDSAKDINPAGGNERVRSFTSSYVCSWQDNIHGETANYTVTYTTNENKVIIELTYPNQAKQSIPFPLDGFRQLSNWLEDHTGGRRVGTI